MNGMMNIKKYYLYVLVILPVLFACEINDPIEDLGETGGFAANIYFVPITPAAKAGTDIDTEVEYWSKDDQFTAIDFFHAVYLVDKISFDLKDVQYTYRYEETREKLEKQVYKSIQHNFTKFNPEKNAYVIKPVYQVPLEYKKVSYKKTNTTLPTLNTVLPDEVKEDFYKVIASGLSKSQLQTILVNVHQVIDQATFDSYYQDGKLTDSGNANVIAKLMSIGIPSLIKDNFSYEVTHRVTLSFQITTSNGETAESVIRGLNIN